MRYSIAVLCALLFSTSALAQVETTPIDRAPVAIAPVPSAAQPPPVLPAHPVRRAIEAAANGGSGGMSYAGPSGAMNTSPNGSSCAVTCSMQPLEQYQVTCNAGFTAMCQCDTAPLAGCRQQQ